MSVEILLCFDYGVRVIVSWLVNEKRPESLSLKIDIVSGLILTMVFVMNLEF